VLEIIVCMKVVIDPEVPYRTFSISEEGKKVVPPVGLPPVFSPFDENALECALRIKDQNECRVTVLSLARAVPKSLLQTALAAGADRAVAIEDPRFEDLDAFSTAAALAGAIRKVGDVDMVFTGRQAADWDAGLVWAGIAEHLDLPCVTVAQKVELRDGSVVVERCVSDGVEVVESALPVLVTVSNEAGELRNVAVAALMKAKRQEITKWSADDISFEPSSLMDLTGLHLPPLEVADRHLVEGADAEEKGRGLARRLAEEGLLEGGN
jgi:electron transfer flavoprotein beta subunit